MSQERMKELLRAAQEVLDDAGAGHCAEEVEQCHVHEEVLADLRKVVERINEEEPAASSQERERGSQGESSVLCPDCDAYAEWGMFCPTHREP